MAGSGSSAGVCMGTLMFIGTSIILSFLSSEGNRGNGTGLSLDLAVLPCVTCVDELEASGTPFDEEDWQDGNGDSCSRSGGCSNSNSPKASALSGWIFRTARRSDRTA